MLLNCGVGTDSWKSPLDSKDIQPVHPKGAQSWVFIGRTAVETETPILWPPEEKSWLIWKDPDAGKDWGQRRGDDRGWDGWMASPTRWTWVWVDSGSWWWTGRPGMLWFMGSQRVGHGWATELNWTETTTVHPKWCRSWVGELALKVSKSKHFKLYRVHSISANSLGSNTFVYNPSAVSKSFLFHQLLQKPMTISHSLLTLYVENHWVMRILKNSQTCSEYLSPPLFSIHFLFRSSLYSQHGTRLKGIEELRPRLIQITDTLAHFFEGQQKQTWEKMFSTFTQKVKMLNYQIKNLSLIN